MAIAIKVIKVVPSVEEIVPKDVYLFPIAFNPDISATVTGIRDCVLKVIGKNSLQEAPENPPPKTGMEDSKDLLVTLEDIFTLDEVVKNPPNSKVDTFNKVLVNGVLGTVLDGVAGTVSVNSYEKSKKGEIIKTTTKIYIGHEF